MKGSLWVLLWWSQPPEHPSVEGHHLLIPPSSPHPPGLPLRQKIPSQTEPGKRVMEGWSNNKYLNCICTLQLYPISKNCYQKGIQFIDCIYRVPSESFASPDPETCLIAILKSQTLKLEESSPATPSTPSPDSPFHSSGQPNSPAESSGCSLSPQLKVRLFIWTLPFKNLGPVLSVMTSEGSCDKDWINGCWK